MAYLNTTTAPTTSFGERATTLFAVAALRFKQRRLYRETFQGLSALTNRDLADLGLQRANLRQVAWESATNAVK